MKKITKPDCKVSDILDNCISSMYNPRKDIIKRVKDEIIKKSDEYDLLGQNGNLFTIKEHTTVLDIAYKQDMVYLYTEKFVPEKEKNYQYYSKIIGLVDICPYCQQKQVRTLDHYLPKTKYVTYSVTPVNLIPSCSDCNKDKTNNSFSDYIHQPFHPYYDDFDETNWLKAKLIENDEIAFYFYADPADLTDTEKAERIKYNFSKKGFALNDIYKVYSAETYHQEFGRIKRLYLAGGVEAAKKDIMISIESYREDNINSWKAAMYQAIIDSEWYWTNYIPRIITNVN